MSPTVESLYRYPVKGFTAEPLAEVALSAGAGFPFDRLYAVEDGASGFDPAAPAFVSKMKFTVLAKIAAVAKARTRFDDQTGVFSAEADGAPSFSGSLAEMAAREAFAAWLSALLGEEASGPLRVLQGPGPHRFTDHPFGHVSLINLNSVRDLEAKMGRPVDPLRFRANIYVEGWPAWAEMDFTNVRFTLGGAQLIGFKPIVRCAATEVDPVTASRDLAVVEGLFTHYKHMFCGLYAHVETTGDVKVGDPLERRS